MERRVLSAYQLPRCLSLSRPVTCLSSCLTDVCKGTAPDMGRASLGECAIAIQTLVDQTVSWPSVPTTARPGAMGTTRGRRASALSRETRER
eukprot:746547-Hanusia_phi.AAC.4